MTFRVERLGEYRVVEHADARDGSYSCRVYEPSDGSSHGVEAWFDGGLYGDVTTRRYPGDGKTSYTPEQWREACKHDAEGVIRQALA